MRISISDQQQPINLILHLLATVHPWRTTDRRMDRRTSNDNRGVPWTYQVCRHTWYCWKLHIRL